MSSSTFQTTSAATEAARFKNTNSATVKSILAALPARKPLVLAIDGPSGSGKSTLAARFAGQTRATLVPLDDFFTTRIAESELHRLPPAQKLAVMFEWDRVRTEALHPLLAGEAAAWRPFDYLAGKGEDGRWALADETTTAEASPLIVLVGWASTAGPLDDLVDATLLVTAPAATRRQRRVSRGDDEFGDVDGWDRDNGEIERWLFAEKRPASAFDFVVSS